MHFLSVSSILLPLAAFALQAHAAALNVSSMLADRGSYDGALGMGAKFRARQDGNAAYIEAGSLSSTSYSETSVGGFTFNDYLEIFQNDNTDSAALIAQVIATGFENVTSLGDVSTAEYAFWYGYPTQQGDYFFTVTIATTITNPDLFNEWANGISTAQAAQSAAEQLSSAMQTSNQVLGCFNPWVANVGWGGPSFVYVLNSLPSPANGLMEMPELAESDILSILGNC